MEKLRSDVTAAIRGCLVSTKGKMLLKQLENDYRTLVGERIPYFKLGFKRLEDFIQSEPSLTMVKGSNGDIYVDAKTSQKSAHISELVDRQKPAKKKVLRKAVRFAHPFKPAATSNWRPKANQGKNFKHSSRPAAVSHNQFISRGPYPKPSVPSKVVIPETSALHSRFNPQLQRSNSVPKKVDLSARLTRTVSDKGVTITNNKVMEECQPLASAKRRITKKMSEINLDRDSGNSSPTSELAVSPILSNNRDISVGTMFANKTPEPPQTNEFVRTDDPVADLKNFAELHKLGNVEISSKLVKTKRNRLFTCLIRIGKNSWGSYPLEFENPLAAEKHCAEEALKELIPKYGRRKSLLLASNKDILERIPLMLEKHNHGVWIWQLQLDYADKYNEQLPVDWLKIIDSSPCIQVEKCLDNYVIRHCKPGDKGQKWTTFMTLSDVSVPSNTSHFGEDSKLYAEVTCVMSANEIWCRQTGTEESDKYSEMVVEMDNYYNENEENLRVDKITEAGYYVAKYDGTWYRVRAVAIKNEEVHCFFIDYGDEMAIAKENIYQLRREFALSQAQAFVCRLVGLEELYEASSHSEILQNLLYKQVILEMAGDNFADENQLDLSIPVFMYDFVSGQSVNQDMIEQLTIESAMPLIQKDTITEAFITNIESNGDVYVQLHSHGYDSLQELLQNLEEQVMENPPTNLVAPLTKANSEGRIYFAKYKLDSHWYRVQIIDWSPNEELAQIYFVDYGNTDVINVKEDVLYPLDKLSDVLTQYPFQAVKVRMSIESIPEDFVALATKAMPVDQPILLKIVEYDDEDVPSVEFFRRNSDGGLFCVNKSITLESEMRRDDGNNNQKSTRKKLAQFDGATLKNVPSSGTLQRPLLPNKGQYFMVHVPFAVNPYNFFVQPLNLRNKLNQMMEDLQERYGNVQFSPLSVEQIVPGDIYASKHEDGYWYRTSVIKVIHSGSISVFYCDFGYYANLTVQQLIPLDAHFMELPYQALKAKLSGIKPKQNKWTMDDCEDFKTLVEKKHFYSVLMDIERDELYESDIVLKLILIDTSSDVDVYIGKELAKKDIAVEVEP